MNTQDLLRLADDVLELDGKATKGPWEWNRNWLWGDGKMVLYYTIDDDGVHCESDGDGPFIAHTRTSAVSLARAVRAMMPFVTHKESCSKHIYDPEDREHYDCDCGLSAALASLGKDAHGRSPAAGAVEEGA